MQAINRAQWPPMSMLLTRADYYTGTEWWRARLISIYVPPPKWEALSEPAVCPLSLRPPSISHKRCVLELWLP